MRKIVFFVLFITLPLLASDSQVDFIAVVADVTSEGEGSVVLHMELNPNFILPVRVSESTELFDEGDDGIQAEELVAGLLLRIKAVFTNEGLLADEVIVKEDESDFRIVGAIQQKGPDWHTITINGLPISISESAEIKNEHNDLIEFSDLIVDQRVRASGKIVNGAYEASRLKIRPVSAAPRIRFKGPIRSISGDQVLVTIKGVGDAVVIPSDQTRVKGTITEGAFVRILGTINPDLTVHPSSMIAQQRLRLGPEILKMQLEQTRRVVLSLREPFEEDITLEIASDNASLASPSVSSLTIEAGKRTAFFKVTAGTTVGKTVITVAMLSDLGFQTSSVDVEVRDKSESKIKVHWRPDNIRLGLGQKRNVRLRLNRPAPAGGLNIYIFLVRGRKGQVDFPALVNIREGKRNIKLPITSLDQPGHFKIRAELPESLGGRDDDLEVQIRAWREINSSQ